MRKGKRLQHTLQIGEPSVIAACAGHHDGGQHNTADVAAGGGERRSLPPLIGWCCVRRPIEWRGRRSGAKMQNISSMAISAFLPPAGLEQPPSGALDTGPGLTLIDWAVTTIMMGSSPMTDGGMAATGACMQVDGRWLALPYFDQPLPKTPVASCSAPRWPNNWRQQAGDLG
ncbi:MAG: anhydro-N-acetylmuramic acid kinase [Caldilineaceae bacterium]